MNADQLNVVRQVPDLVLTLKNQITLVEIVSDPETKALWTSRALSSAVALTKVLDYAEQLGAFNPPLTRPVKEIDSVILDKLNNKSRQYTDSYPMFAKFINDYMFDRN